MLCGTIKRRNAVGIAALYIPTRVSVWKWPIIRLSVHSIIMSNNPVNNSGIEYENNKFMDFLSVILIFFILY